MPTSGFGTPAFHVDSFLGLMSFPGGLDFLPWILRDLIAIVIGGKSPPSFVSWRGWNSVSTVFQDLPVISSVRLLSLSANHLRAYTPLNGWDYCSLRVHP